MFRAAAVSLAQASDSATVVWSVVLIIFVLILFGVVAWLRKRLSPHEDFHGEGFTFSDLRRLHKEGKISDEELEKAKAGLIAMAQASEKRKQEEQQNLKQWGWETKPPK